MRIPPSGFTEPVIILSTAELAALGIPLALIQALALVFTKEGGAWTA
ncbi:MAG: hypothetical protein QHC90_28100 [Shinella sp.]|jgi:hypothetical protein|nr:hypothetical protein [Shinella sp.]